MKVIARQVLTATVCDKLLNANANRWEEHKQSLPPFVTFPWLEEIRKFRCIDYENDYNHTIIAPFQNERTNFYSICYFGSLIRFAHFMITLGEELPSLPPLTPRHWFFIIEIFEQLSCSEKQSCPETFHCDEIFSIFQEFWATCGLPWKTECVLNSLYWIYIYF